MQISRRLTPVNHCLHQLRVLSDEGTPKKFPGMHLLCLQFFLTGSKVVQTPRRLLLVNRSLHQRSKVSGGRAQKKPLGACLVFLRCLHTESTPRRPRAGKPLPTCLQLPHQSCALVAAETGNADHFGSDARLGHQAHPLWLQSLEHRKSCAPVLVPATPILLFQHDQVQVLLTTKQSRQPEHCCDQHQWVLHMCREGCLFLPVGL